MSEYKCKEGMIDNRMVHDTHQEGIKRVLQRKENRKDVAGHSGKMGRGDKAHWNRKGDSLTPRKA
jgi:hypothetical protein